MPALIGVETEKSLCRVSQIRIYGMDWQIRYHEKLRIIYGLEKVVQHFSLVEFDAIVFSFDMDGELCGRIFKSNGMEIVYYTPGSICSVQECEDCFIFEEKHSDSRLDMGMFRGILLCI